jgi:pimeloyl-ACP methyl ester carboxylesterase
MTDPFLGLGIFLVVVGLFVLAFARLYPESVRKENRRVRNLRRRTRDAGLRGTYNFARDRAKWDTIVDFGTYEPADDEDRALYAAVGSRIESESEFFAKAALWNDARLAWVGIPALLIGAALCAVSVLG